MKKHASLALAALLNGLEAFRQRARAEALPVDLAAPALNREDASILQEALRLAAPVSGPSRAGSELLEAITERIAVTPSGEQRRNNDGARHYCPITALALSDQVFPVEMAKAQRPADNQYHRLWDEFINEARRLPLDAEARFVSLTYLLHKYTWCIPSASAPTVSMHDLSRVTAALAVCLAEAGQSADAPFLFIEGGISGIQRFIYNPTFNGQELYDGMARRLRGRSFYLNLLVKTVADYLNEALRLPCVNTLWATGGNFLIVAPHTTAMRAKLQQARHTIQQWLWREYRGALGVVIADEIATRENLRDFGKLCARLEQKSAEQKLRQAELPLSFGEDAPDKEKEVAEREWANAWVLKMQLDICKDTGRDLTEVDVKVSAEAQRDKEEQENPPSRSGQSLLFDAIGRGLIEAQTLQLRRADDWMLDSSIPRLPRDPDKNKRLAEAQRLRGIIREVLIEFRGLGRTWLLSKKEDPRSDAELCLRIGDQRNRELKFLSSGGSPTVARGFELMATAVHLSGRTAKVVTDFHELAKTAEGPAYLGALRMDLDNLGYIFAKGLAEQDRSLAKIANLSRMLDWFFTGYLNTLIDGKPLYTTYAGGDDLFVVGAWNEALTLAETIQRQFKAFCGQHPDLHISGGLVLCKGKYPIGRAALDAGARLDQIAKSFKHNPLTEKDALCFLENKIPWKRWVEVRELGQKMIAAWNQGQLSRKFIYNLLELYWQYIDPQRQPGSNDLPPKLLWLPKFKYSVVRNVADDLLRVELVSQIPKHEPYLSILAGYVLLKTRNRNDQGQSAASLAGFAAIEEAKRYE
jgi:CRISPR-associated protein Csm1